jgi:hypothetical protein
MPSYLHSTRTVPAAMILTIKLLALVAVYLVSDFIICRRILQSDKLTYDGDGSKMRVHTEFKCIHGAPLVCGLLACVSLWGFISGLRNQKLLERQAGADGDLDADNDDEDVDEEDEDDDDVGRFQDADDDDDEENHEDDKSKAEDEEINDEDAGQESVQQMGMAQIVIYVEQGGTVHINV